ncbi:MAG: ATP synthase subunit I [Neisseria sp.]|nr:ATP synthase subunit I [Neisseria sp.]
MVKILYLQLAALTITGMASGLLGGAAALWSAVAGGMSYLIPSALAALVINLSRRVPQYAGYAFIVGEGLRIMLALVLMVACFALCHQNLKFLPFFFGLLTTSHVIFFTFWKVRYYGKRK